MIFFSSLITIKNHKRKEITFCLSIIFFVQTPLLRKDGLIFTCPYKKYDPEVHGMHLQTHVS